MISKTKKKIECENTKYGEKIYLQNYISKDTLPNNEKWKSSKQEFFGIYNSKNELIGAIDNLYGIDIKIYENQNKNKDYGSSSTKAFLNHIFLNGEKSVKWYILGENIASKKLGEKMGVEFDKPTIIYTNTTNGVVTKENFYTKFPDLKKPGIGNTISRIIFGVNISEFFQTNKVTKG